MKIEKNIFLHVNEVKHQFLFIIFWGFVSSLCIILQAYLLSRIINNIFLLHQSFEANKLNFYWFLTVSVLKFIFTWLQSNYSADLVKSIKLKYRKIILDHLYNIGPIKLKNEKLGEIINLLSIGVDKLEEYYSKYIPQLILAILIPVFILVIVLPLDWLTAVIFFITAPIIPIFMYLIGSIADGLNKKQWNVLGRMSALFYDVLVGAVTIKLYNQVNQTINKISEVTNQFKVRTLKVLRIAFLSALVLEITATISVAVIAVEIGLRLLSGSFDFQRALFILIIAPEFYMPLRQLGASYHSGLEGVSALESISKLLNQPITNNITFSKKNDNFFEDNGSIIFNNVSFSYDSNKSNAIDNISFEIERGKITALVGISGSGKTTVMSLLLKLITPNTGKILIGKKLLEDISNESWREEISWMPQIPHIFNSTLLKNITLAKPNATLDEITQAITNAEFDKVVDKLPNKLNTYLGEGGLKLSGGEQQRLALARVFLKKSKLILIDEPTTNLDPVLESRIQNNLNNFYKNKTVVVVAHKLHTIMNADKIILLNNGRIIDSGSHETLMTSCSQYSNLLSKVLDENIEEFN